MNKRFIVAGAIVAVTGVLAWAGWSRLRPAQNTQALEEFRPAVGTLTLSITTTGVVEPQNRLEIKPPIGGRVEEIRVKEGDYVKAGQVLALMSSTERAALLDAAHLKGPEELAYWKRVYKPTPLLAPIDGRVIVRAVEPGQTVTASDAVFVLADRLIVQADVDETDIGGVAVGQRALIGLDAYPDIKAEGVVDHISFESTLVNNVTIYQVEILPTTVPEVFRSGMSATIEIIRERRENALLLPVSAVQERDGKTFVDVRDDSPQGYSRRMIRTGLSDLSQVEVLEGLSAEDRVVVPQRASQRSKTDNHGNDNGKQSPFVPNFQRGRGSGRR